MRQLRADLLAGQSIAAAGPLRGVVLSALEALGAQVRRFDESLTEEQALGWAAEREALGAVIYDARVPFGDGGPDGLMAAIERAWPAVRAVAAGALIPAGAGGRVVLIAPAADAHPLAHPARAALENMARTLSIEWARHAITATAIAPGATTSDTDVAALIAFLLSPGGAYLSGCRFELDSLAAAS